MAVKTTHPSHPANGVAFDNRLQELRDRYAKSLSHAIIRPNGPTQPQPRAMLSIGQHLRDEQIWQYPILPGAIQVYQELASTREWTLSGTPRSVMRGIEWFNQAQTINPYTGQVYFGYDNLLRRQVLDYLIIGMISMAASDDLPDSPAPPPLEYLDPTLLRFDRLLTRPRPRGRPRNAFVDRVKPEEKVWLYGGSRMLRAQDVRDHYPLPIGAAGFASPILYLLPTAIMAWLIRESDSANIDGRKIRDIIFVDNPQMQDAVEQALLQMLAVWEGADPEDVGIPIIALSGASNKPVRDLFARLGLSEIPANLDREKFIFYYVNEVAAALGLALRHFWNNERTTNRALEEVQEQRQQQKGPATFVRTQQRLINNSGWLLRFGTPRNPLRFGFLEETDLSAMKDRAEALKNIAEAFGVIMDRLGASISLDNAVAWLKMEDLLPNEMEVIDGDQAAVMQDSDTQMPGADDQISSSDPQPTTLPQEKLLGGDLERYLNYGEIMMNGSGHVLGRRHKIISINRILDETLRYERDLDSQRMVIDESVNQIEPEPDLSDMIAKAIKEADTKNVLLVRQLALTPFVSLWRERLENKTLFAPFLMDSALYNCFNRVALTDDERKVIDRIALDWETQESSS